MGNPKAHASRGYKCELCGQTVFGNGGKVSHGRAHVRRSEAVELVKDYASYPLMTSRVFIAAEDKTRIEDLLNSGFREETQ
jgi:hypothetical protein